MEDLKLSNNVEIKLMLNGWTENHFIDISATKLEWQADGYKVFESGIIFLQKFNNIKLNHEAYTSAKEDYSVFDSLKAVRNIDPSWVLEDYQLKSKSNLLPIGLGYSEHLTYFIDPSYNFYGGYDDFFCHIGKSVDDFFQNIFFRKKFITL